MAGGVLSPFLLRGEPLIEVVVSAAIRLFFCSLAGPPQLLSQPNFDFQIANQHVQGLVVAG